MFAIRFSIALYLLAARFVILRVKDQYLFPVANLSILLTAFSISLTCFVSGQGFASPYYAGILIVIIFLSVFFHFTPKQYGVILAGVILEHFFLLSLIANQTDRLMVNLMRNIMVIGIISLTGFIAHNLIYRLTQEVKTLKGLVPICGKCKKIRNDQGFWQQLEMYVRSHAEVEFSHGICPECAKQYEKQIEAMARRLGTEEALLQNGNQDSGAAS